MDSTQDQANGSGQCGSCDSSSFSCWCLDCQEALCEDCVSAHKRVSVTRSHRLLNQPPTGHTSTPPTKFCRLHPSEPLKLYCLTCNQLTCRDCQLMTHKNHRYEFVSDALDWLKKQLADQVQPIRAQRDTVRRSMQDMKTRLQDILQCESSLKFELRQSFSTFLQHLKSRMDQLIQEIKSVHESECERIHRRMLKLTELQKCLQSVTEAEDEAQNINDLVTLQTYRTQIESQLKDLSDQDLSPPQTIPQMKVVTDTNSLVTILNFGKLEVSWVPFCVSKTFDQDPNSPVTTTSSILPPTTTSLQSTCTLQAGTTYSTSPSSAVHSTLCPPCSTSNSSTSSTSPTAFPPTSSCTPLSQTGANMRCSSVAPVNLLPTSVQLSLLPFSSSLTGSAPPSFTSICPNPPTGGLNATVKQHCNHRLPSLHKSLNNKRLLPVTSDSSLSLFTVMPPAARMGTTSDSVLLRKPTTHQVSPPISTSGFCSFPTYTTPLTAPLGVSASSQNLKQFSAPFVKSSSVNSSLVIQPLLSKLNTNLNQVQLKFIQSASTFSLVLQPHKSGLVTPAGSSSSDTILKSVPGVLDQPLSHSTNQTAAFLLQDPSLGLPLTLPQPTTHVNADAEQATPVPQSPVVAAENTIPLVPSPTAKVNSTLVDSQSSGTITGPASSLHADAYCISPDSSLPEHEDLSQVVKAVADSACDHTVQQVEASREEPAENEPTSTMCEETEPAESECETTENSSKESKSGSGKQNSSLSQWQPKVSLFRLPLPPYRPGRPLPTFRLVQGNTEDEIYLEEISDDCESHYDDESEQLSCPDSPVTLQVVSCSACGTANSSIICFSCGRGYHRDCHVPPVGPNFWSEWMCSLCQDLSDTSDPYKSERCQTPLSPCLSPLDQRRCESLLLYLKVEGCGQLSQARLAMMSERLSLRHSPPYPTAAEFLSDIWTLFTQRSSQQLEDDPLNNLQKTFHMKSIKMFGPNLHPSLLTPPDLGSHKRHQNKDVRTESRLKETRKRLRQFLVLMGTPAAKRNKTVSTQESVQ